MLHKLKQQINRYRFTSSNRLPNRRARQFLVNYLRRVRTEAPSPAIRAAIGLVQWSTQKFAYRENRVSFRTGCFITGRSRGTSRRFTVARTKIKELSDKGKLFGARKSSW